MAKAWAGERETVLVVSEVSPTPCPMVLEHPLLDWAEMWQLLADLTQLFCSCLVLSTVLDNFIRLP